MATKPGRRERLRAEREARERAALASERRKRRLWQLGAVLALAALLVAIGIAVSQSGSKHVGGRAGARVVQRELAGIPQSGIALGRRNAPVTITEYADLQCPVCQEFALGTLAELTTRDVRSGRVRFLFRNLQTATSDSKTFKSEAVAALAAGRQNRLWDFVELFYRNQGPEGSGYVNDGFLSALARQIPGLDLARWNRDRGDPRLAAQLEADASSAARLGFGATPSLLVQGPHFPARSVVGAASYGDVVKAIQAVLH